MPKVVTAEFAKTSYKVMYPGGNADEFLIVKPLAASRIRAIAAEVQASSDIPAADKVLEMGIRVAGESIKGWSGFTDIAGKPIDYSQEALRFVAENQPDVYGVIGKMIASAVATGEPVKE